MPTFLRSLYVMAVQGTVLVAWRSIATAETVVWSVIFHDDLGGIDDS
jgi:hypothetical protein